MRLTDAKTGEKLSNFQSFTKGGLIIAGRAYGTIAGIEYLLRYRTGVFNLYTAAQERVEVTDFFKGLEAMNRMKIHGNPPSEEQLADNRYVIVTTFLLETGAELVMQLYRFRRQIELVFKRLKSLFPYNQIVSKVEAPARTWFYGKLLLAAFCET